MLPRQRFSIFLCSGMLAIAVGTSPARGVDFEAFEFNDANGTELFQASNSANSGNAWFTTNGGVDVLPSEVRNGSFEIYKDTNAFVSSYLQIDNISTGKVYMIAQSSGWALRDFDSAEREEVRFGFLAEDTGNSGNTIAAQIEFERTAAGGFELNGMALGAGATNIASVVDLPLDQTTPFTTVLEFDKDQNIYKVFYKDGSNPSQVLGAGNLSAGRDANSIRLVMNNNWGSDFETTNEEHFGIDRFAISDTNPLTDLLSAVVDRDSGMLTLTNTTGAALDGLVGLFITSDAGSLDADGWQPITGNYDASGTGDGSVDPNDAWTVDFSSPQLLSESSTGVTGGALSVDQPVVLSQGSDGIWVKSPFEDIAIELIFAGGDSRTADVSFVGNSGMKFGLADLDFDGQLAASDWLIFVANAETDLSGLSIAQSYQRGDLDSDGVNSFLDFGLFKGAYETANGAGSFERMLASIPEPSPALLLLLGLMPLLASQRR